VRSRRSRRHPPIHRSAIALHADARQRPGGLEYAIRPVTCAFSGALAWSRGGVVLAGEAAEHLLSADPVVRQVDLRRLGARLSGRELSEGAVRPGGVVVLQVLGQYLAQVELAEDQQPVE
jgi:hypothetical protein